MAKNSKEFCGGCCSNVTIVLNSPEADSLKACGTQLEPLLVPPVGAEPAWNSQVGRCLIMKQAGNAFNDGNKTATNTWIALGSATETMRADDGAFSMVGDCGNLLKDGTCANYEARPNVCKIFQLGSFTCRSLQGEVLEDLVSEVSVRIL